MKNISLLVVFILFKTLPLNAQIEKRNWIVGGIAYLNSYKYIGEVNNETINHLKLSPNIGYFIANKFVSGLSLSYSLDNYKNRNVKYSNYSVSPFLRYYFLNNEKMFNVFTQISYGYEEGKASNNRNAKYHYNGFGFRLGSSLFFNSSVALEIALDYNTTNLNSTSNLNAFQVGLGFQIHLQNN